MGCSNSNSILDEQSINNKSNSNLEKKENYQKNTNGDINNNIMHNNELKKEIINESRNNEKLNEVNKENENNLFNNNNNNEYINDEIKKEENEKSNISEYDNKLNNIIDEINIIYNNEDDSVKIFGSEFVRNNKNICKIIYENQEYELQEYINIINNEKENIEIKLKGINNITNMSHLFHECESLSSLPDISKWDTSNVTNMRMMFYKCKS